MHFNCLQSEFRKAVDTVQCVVGNVRNSVLDCILLECAEDGLTIRATDGTTSIRTRLNAEIRETGVMAIPAKPIREILKKLPNSEVSVQEISESSAKLQCGSTRVTLRLFPPDNFPEFPAIQNAKTLELTQRQLRTMIRAVEFAVAKTDDRPILTGILFESVSSYLRLVAIDGCRLAVRSTCLPGATEGSFTVPAEAVRTVASVMADTDDPVKIEFNDVRVRFSTGDTEIMSSLLQGTFVPYQSLFPKTFATEVQADRESVMHAVERAIVVTDTDEYSTVKLAVQENDISISADSEIADVNESVASVTQGNDVSLFMNGNFFMDVLKSVNSPDIKLHINDDRAPCYIQGADESAYQYLILPIIRYQ